MEKGKMIHSLSKIYVWTCIRDLLGRKTGLYAFLQFLIVVEWIEYQPEMP
jgi:hypothetical protein